MLNTRYILDKTIVIEDFADESLIFLPRERQLIKINSITRSVLSALDGEKTVEDIVKQMVSTSEISLEIVLKDIYDVLAELAALHVIKDHSRLAQIEENKVTDNTRYTINRDISCRIEDPEEGAILFNPETDAVNVINPIGLAIWQALEYPLQKSEIIEHLLDLCEDAPMDEMSKDVDEFIEKLTAAGFLGEVIE